MEFGMIKSLVKSFYRNCTNWRWEIGFLNNSLEGVVNGEELQVNWVKLPFKDRWFADPFILDYNEDEIVLLCEEYSDELKKGRIAKLIIDRKTFEFKSWKIIHELKTHLSFPRVIREDNEIYIHPENCASGNHTLYKYDKKTDCLVDGRIICDAPLTDAIMLDYAGHHLLFSTFKPNPNGNILTVFDKRDGQYIKMREVVFDNNCARMAGDFFRVGDKLYRPAQDCNGGYGKAVIIQEAICNAFGEWSFKNVRRVVSNHPILDWGLHTFNHYNGLTVIDVKGARYPFLYKCLIAVRRVFNQSLFAIK